MLSVSQWVFVGVVGYCLLLSMWSWFVLVRVKNIYRLLADPTTPPWALKPGQYDYFTRTVSTHYLPGRVGREFLHWFVVTLAVLYCWIDAIADSIGYAVIIVLVAFAIVFMVFQAYFKLRLFSTYLVENGFVLRANRT